MFDEIAVFRLSAPELVAGRVVVGELPASEEPGTLPDIAAGPVEGSTSTKGRTLKAKTEDCLSPSCTTQFMAIRTIFTA